jgi:hypothetical protein
MGLTEHDNICRRVILHNDFDCYFFYAMFSFSAANPDYEPRNLMVVKREEIQH